MSTADRTSHREKQAVAAWIRLMRVYTKIDRGSADALRTAGLTMAQFDVLAQLGATGGISQQQLADRLLVTKGNIAQLLDRMEERGLVERRPVAVGRGNAVTLTPDGEALRAQVLAPHERSIAARMDVLSDEEMAQLATLLRKLDHALDGR